MGINCRRLDLLLSNVSLGLLVTVDVVHLGGKGLSGLPGSRLARGNLGHELIGLLKRETLELRNEEVGEGNADAAERTPEEEHLGAKVGLGFTDQVWGDD